MGTGQLLLGHPVYLDTGGEKNCICSGKWEVVA